MSSKFLLVKYTACAQIIRSHYTTLFYTDNLDIHCHCTSVASSVYSERDIVNDKCYDHYKKSVDKIMFYDKNIQGCERDCLGRGPGTFQCP